MLYIAGSDFPPFHIIDIDHFPHAKGLNYLRRGWKLAYSGVLSSQFPNVIFLISGGRQQPWRHGVAYMRVCESLKTGNVICSTRTKLVKLTSDGLPSKSKQASKKDGTKRPAGRCLTNVNIESLVHKKKEEEKETLVDLDSDGDGDVT